MKENKKEKRDKEAREMPSRKGSAFNEKPAGQPVHSRKDIEKGGPADPDSIPPGLPNDHDSKETKPLI